VMAELCSYFSAKGRHEIHLVLYGITREIFYTIPEGVIVHRPKFPFNNKRRFISTLKTLIYLRTEIKSIDPRSILSFGEYWNSFVLLALFGLGQRVYVSDRSQPDKSLGVIHDRLRKWLYPRAEGVIAQTRKAREIYRLIYPHSNMVSIGNPVRTIRNGHNGKARENIVLSVGRLIRSKHHDELIRLFAEINDDDWKLVIVGYDHLKQKNMDRLKLLTRELGVEDRVELTGKRNDIERFYLKSKIFAFTSSSEGFPNVIGEALSSGLPVVSFDCIAGPAEMVEDGVNGFLVPLFDYELFRSRLSLLMRDEALRERMAIEARQSIGKFSPEIIGEKYYEFIMQQ